MIDSKAVARELIRVTAFELAADKPN